jgi:hypothetical protein
MSCRGFLGDSLIRAHWRAEPRLERVKVAPSHAGDALDCSACAFVAAVIDQMIYHGSQCDAVVPSQYIIGVSLGQR